MGLPDVKFHDSWPVARGGNARPGSASRRGRGSRRYMPRWVRLALATLLLLLTATIVVVAVADHDQPLRYGASGYSNEYFRGLATSYGS